MLRNQEVVGPGPALATTQQVQAVNHLVRRDTRARALPGGVAAGGGVNVDVSRCLHDAHEGTCQMLAVHIAGPATESQQVAGKLGGIKKIPYSWKF